MKSGRALRYHQKMNVRKRRMDLSFEQKETIIKRLKSGDDESLLAMEFGVCKRTIRRVQCNKDNLETQISNLTAARRSKSQKRVSSVETSPVEKALLTWLLQKRSLNEQVSGPILQEQAIALNTMLGGPDHFKASNGWLEKFKKRHGINILSMQSVKFSTDVSASDDFCATFKATAKENKYELSQIYNADETGLYWKSLPHKTLAAPDVVSATEQKEPTDRVTILVCANADGTHKLPLFLIGKSEKPQCFKNGVNLPVVYTGQKRAWMDRDLFIVWYTTVFVPQVHENMIKKYGEARKVLLLLDNAPSHSSVEHLNAIDEMFQVMYLPSKVTPLIQPMNQGIIKKMKRLYRGKILRELLSNKDEIAGESFVRDLNMTDCCMKITSSWNNLAQEDLTSAWNMLLPGNGPIREYQFPCENLEEILDILRRVPSYQDYTADSISSWLRSDEDCKCQTITDNEILERFQTEGENSTTTGTNDDSGPNSDNEDGDETKGAVVPSTEEALAALTIYQRWFQSRWECRATHVMQLEKMRDITTDIIWRTKYNEYNADSKD